MANTYKPKPGNPAGGNVSATLTTVYTVASATTALIKSVYVANIHATNSGTFDMCVTLSGVTGDIYLIKGVSISPGTTLQILEEPLALGPGDIVKFKASAASTLDAIFSILEIT
jgi:hypothetical protein